MGSQDIWSKTDKGSSDLLTVYSGEGKLVKQKQTMSITKIAITINIAWYNSQKSKSMLRKVSVLLRVGGKVLLQEFWT